MPRTSFKPGLMPFSSPHILCIANSSSPMFSIKNNSCDEFTRTASFKHATRRIALRALTTASSFLLGFREENYVTSDDPYDIINNDGHVFAVLLHSFKNTSPFFVGLCSGHSRILRCHCHLYCVGAMFAMSVKILIIETIE